MIIAGRPPAAPHAAWSAAEEGRFGTATVINDATANGKALHLIADNAETQKQLTVRKWLRGFHVFSVTFPFFEADRSCVNNTGRRHEEFRRKPGSNQVEWQIP